MPNQIPKSFADIQKNRIHGIPRPIDDVGRLVIPMEYRKALGLVEDRATEIFLIDGGLFIRKAVPMSGSISESATAQ